AAAKVLAGRGTAGTEAVREVVRGAGLALLALALLAPAFHPWYFLWPLVLLSVSLRHPRGLAALSITAAVLCFLVLPDGYNLARLTLVPGTLATITATLVLAAMAINRLRTHRARGHQASA
ncbi:MAG TPA: hypothetical protein VHU91_09180, partial [Mycobacteriales bacterium]|nr:hypothetical protein [Mycobacteriales bacterium]